ncbi:MAG: 4-(cytidine 5'-diphospho)-2-C-methyl-D-erythritol kinase [Candidatus Omnitrophica bacterium]|nr:4-(cytidine 5'-diphospho)-2-C-methyl-D-erythritol kinase [Candidatus Omnitrophota bacterium]
MKIRAPAKINLFLNVRRRRPDGTHEIETLFERVSLCDTLTLSPRKSGIKLECSDPKIPSGPENLAFRAAALLRAHTGVRKGVFIKLEKKIPVAAGLGGGSSDAAAVLLGLNRLWRLHLSKKKLRELAFELGSDVPFFVLETSFALGRGRGEILKRIPAHGRRIWHCLVKPPFGISTKAAYGALKTRHLTPQKPDAKMLLHSIQKGDVGTLSKLLANSLELSLNKRVKTIFEIKESLKNQGAMASLMSGSGSSVFGVFGSMAAAFRASRFFRKRKGWQVFVTSTY